MGMNKFAEIIIGLILLVAPLYAWIVNFRGFGDAALMVFKGGLVWGLMLIGILFLILGLSDLRE